jgi:hypothetical protein
MREPVIKYWPIIVFFISWLVGAVWWAADQSARLKTVEASVIVIPRIERDISAIKAVLVPSVSVK